VFLLFYLLFDILLLFQAMATPAKQTFGPKRAFGDDITNSSKKDLKGTRTPMQQTSFTPRQSSAGDNVAKPVPTVCHHLVF
jgi:hypothetical protein